MNEVEKMPIEICFTKLQLCQSDDHEQKECLIQIIFEAIPGIPVRIRLFQPRDAKDLLLF